MKKFFSGILALSLAIGAVAFTEVKEASMTDYFWYKRTGVNTYVVDHSPNTASPTPLTSCSGDGMICVKGFLTSQTASAIRDTTTAQQILEKNP